MNPLARIKSVRRQRALFIGAAAVVITILAASILPSVLVKAPDYSPPTPAVLGFTAPDFTLPTDQNGRVSLSKFQGRVIVINFVILVCCSESAVEMLYTMRPLWPTFATKGVVFISIAMKSVYNYFSPSDYRKIMNFTWTLALDNDGRIQDIYGARETSTYLIDRVGILRDVSHTSTNSTTLSAWLQELI